MEGKVNVRKARAVKGKIIEKEIRALDFIRGGFFGDLRSDLKAECL